MTIVHWFSSSGPPLLRWVLLCASGLPVESRTLPGPPAPMRALPDAMREAESPREGVTYLPAALARNCRRGWRTRPGTTPRLRFLSALSGRLFREERASASIELAIGAVAVLAVAAVAFDLYSLTRAYAAGSRIAATMADYVSRESAPDGDQMAALGRFLHEQDFGMPSALVYVISSVHQPPGDDPPEELWEDDLIRIGDAEDAAALTQECKSRGQTGWRAAVLGDAATLTLEPNGVVIVVEVCARLLREGMLSELVAGNLYRVHALPVRSAGVKPAEPSYAPVIEEAAVSAGNSAGEAVSLHDRSVASRKRAAAVTHAAAKPGKIA